MQRLSGPIPSSAFHVVVDMQRLFSGATDWRVPRFSEVIEPISQLLRHQPDRAIFTRFMPAAHPESAKGQWRTFYRHWRNVALDRLSPDQVEIDPRLAGWAIRQFDKTTFSAFSNPDFVRCVTEDSAGCLIISGIETEICVLATVLDAVDHGLRVILPIEALTSAIEKCHDLALEILYERFDVQVEVAPVATIIEQWPRVKHD